MKNLFTIDLKDPYLPTLAKGILERFSNEDRLNMDVLLPSERAVFSLQKAFSLHSGTYILPTLKTFSKLDESSSKEAITALERSHFVIESLKLFFKDKDYSHVQKLSVQITQLWDELILSGKTLNDLLLLRAETYQYSIVQKITEAYINFLANQNLFDIQEKTVYALLNYNPQQRITLMAGTTGTIPAVRMLSKKLLSTANGYVVLPGLVFVDQNYAKTHPLHTQSLWVKELIIEENDSIGGKSIQQFSKSDLSYLFLDNLYSNKVKHHDVDHIMNFDCSTVQEEAFLISILVRHHLHLNQTISIVCNNQHLSHLIQNTLSRYDFLANQPVSIRLQYTVCGVFFFLYLQYCQKQDLKNLLALLKHPLYAANNRQDHLKKVEFFESSIKKNDKKTYSQLLQLFPEIAIDFPKYLPLSEWIDLVKKKVSEHSDHKVFIYGDGKKLETYLEILKNLSHKKKSFYQFFEWIKAYFEFSPYFQQGESLHQDVVLLGTIEARNLSSDVIIFCNLNEEEWPSDQQNNIWLSEADRRHLNLPHKERKIGLAAHDFSACLKAKKVYLTRSIKQGGVETTPNRWLQRLRLNTNPTPHIVQEKEWFLKICHLIGRADHQEERLPVYPKVLQKPQKLSVSAIELLNSDPHAFYLRYILKLIPREEWYKGFSPATLGQLIHKILEKLESNSTLSYDQIMDEEDHENVFFTSQIKRVVTFVKENIDWSKTLKKEEKLSLFLKDGTEIYGIADLILFEKDSPIQLIDYKTGSVPTYAAIKNGLSLQMPLLSAMLFNKQDADSVQYWSLKGYKEQSKIIDVAITKDIIVQALMIVENLLNYYFEDVKESMIKHSE